MNFSTTRNCSSNVRSGRGGLGSCSGSGSSSVKYIYELPYFERKELCRIFDESNQWEMLGGGLMGYSSSELSEFGRAVFRGASPTDSLLTAWGSQNHTILEMFTLLGRLHHFRGMRILAKFVESKYHVYIREPEVNATVELIQMETRQNVGVGPVEVKVQNIIADSPNLPDSDTKNKDIKNENELKLASVAESCGLLPQIPYDDLLLATNNWDRRNILGKGGFGTVFKGVWKNTAVAIKRMEQRANHAYVESQLKQSLGELKFLNTCRHDNILPLYGFSLEGQHPCLVYQYMVSGSLEDRLLCRQKTIPLSWSLRYQIARGVACGIQFLHSIGSKPLIHGDIKSANILLDRNFEAKVGDFGLAREMSSDASYVKVSRVHGTRPYLPDEYLRSKKLSTKVDTFSFGIMLFEIATGQRAYEESRSKKFLKEMLDEVEGNLEILKDPKGGLDNPDIFGILVKLGKACTQRLAKDRPDMIKVLKSLEGLMTQASSIRTISSHVTGLPLLFETPNSRPASLLMPVGNSTTHRLSPEMRAGSPYWMPQQQVQQPKQYQVLDSAASSVRRSPLPSIPSPQYFQPQQHHIFHPVNIITNNTNNIPSPTSHPVSTIATTPTTPGLLSPNLTDTTSSNSSNNSTHKNNNNPNPMVNQPNNNHANFNNNHPPHTNNNNNGAVLINDMNILAPGGGSGGPENFPIPVTVISDDQFIPLVLDHCGESLDNEEDDQEPTTVIPLITELGIKD